MPSVINEPYMLIVAMLNVVMLSVIVLSVMAPQLKVALPWQIFGILDRLHPLDVAKEAATR
jgi:hypothetical protein